MVVQHNMQAMNSNRMLGVTTSAQAKSTEKLSSGYKINRAADDAAGLSISEKMRSQIRGLTQASSNAQDGISCVQTAEGALTEVHSMLQRMNELAVKASNGTMSEDDRQNVQDEMDQLLTEIDRVSETTKFNETYLLKGNGETSVKTLNAHDAGFTGKLTDNGDGTSEFRLDKSLAVGDTISIAGEKYSIGKSKDPADYIKLADVTGTAAPSAVGDSVTSNGITTSIVAKATITDVNTTAATKLSWTENDTFTDADGVEWKVSATAGDAATKAADGKTGTVGANNVAALIKDGAVITKNVSKHIGDGDANQIAEKLEVVDELASTEVSKLNATAVTALTTNLKVGDTITVAGVSKEVTAETPTAMDKLIDEVKKATSGQTLAIGSKSYTVGTTTDEANNKITADDFIAKIKEGDTVTVNGTAYTAIGVSGTEESGNKSITVDEAYKKIAEELTKASSIGADVGATVKNMGDGSFTITQGSVTVKDALTVGLHVGADADVTNKISMNIAAMDTAGLGIRGLNVGDDTTGTNATYAIDAIADAIKSVSAQRSELGAVQNRLEHTIANLDNVVENTTSAESAIRDTDMASEMVAYSKNNILSQAGQSMLAQANQSTQGVLSLLQ